MMWFNSLFDPSANHTLSGISSLQTLTAMYLVDAPGSAGHIIFCLDGTGKLEALHSFERGNALHIADRHRHESEPLAATHHIYALGLQLLDSASVGKFYHAEYMG